jgi:SAM-dependent methyltransferase
MVDVTGDAVQAYYARGEERDRLSIGRGLVEYARTVEVISRTLPRRPAVVADIGGGPGRYTDWLREAGYTVFHRDLVADHVTQVASRHPDIDSRVCDARSLDLDDAAVDAVLLLGPIYHLAAHDDRIVALREARRIARRGAPIYVAAITPWAARLDGILIKHFHVEHPDLLTHVDEVERTRYLPPAHEGGFSCATHTADQLRDEIAESGLAVEGVVQVESIAFALADIEERMNDPVERALVLDTIRAVESVPDLLGSGPHLLATARA